MNEIIKMVVGFDQRESVAYHTFVQSIIEKSSLPVSFTPLSINTLKGYEEKHEERSNLRYGSSAFRDWHLNVTSIIQGIINVTTY